MALLPFPSPQQTFAFPILALLAVLAVGLLFLLPGGLLQAQDDGSGAGCEENSDKTGYDCEYAENGNDPVATFTATDPEGNPVSWDLDETGGADHLLFAISKDGVLSFKSSPDYEASGTDNQHEVTVRATDNAYDIAGDAGNATTKTGDGRGDKRGGAWEGEAHRQWCDRPASRCCSRRWMRS